MADLSDMRMFSAKMIPSEPIVWRVSSQPVVAQFEQQGTQSLQHLGLPFNHNGESNVVMLWIGFRESTRELLVTLTIRVKIGSERHTRKQSSRRGRLMFLIVPVESLAVCCTDVAYHTLSDDPVLAPILDSPSDWQSADSMILKIDFDIGTTRSFVVMPSDKVTGVQSRQSTDLLDQLKSLSEVSRFCLFANHDRALQQAVESVQAILDQRTATVTTPTVELKAFYPGRRRAAVNLWEHQGWHQREKEERKQRRQSEGRHDAAPPYTRPRREQRLIDTAGQYRVNPAASPPPPEYTPSASSTPVSAKGPRLLPPPNRHDQPLVDNNACTSSNPADNFPVSNSHDERIFSSRTAPPPQLSEPSLSPNYSADLLSELSRSSKFGPEVATPACPTAFLQVPQSSSSASDRRTGIIRARSPSVHILDTPSKKRLTTFEHSSSATSNTSIPASLLHQQPDGAIGSGDVHRQNLLHMTRRGVYISSTIVDGSSARSMLLPSSPYDLPASAAPSASNNSTHAAILAGGVDALDLGLCFTQWMIQAWTIYPDAHYSFITDLLALGSDVSNNDKRAFNERRIDLTTTLLRNCTKQNNSDTDLITQTAVSLPDRHNAKAMLPRLISWLYALEPTVSLTTFEDLLSLSQLEQRMLSCNNSFEKVYKRYVEECACVVSRACVWASQQVERGDVSMRMRQERGRSG